MNGPIAGGHRKGPARLSCCHQPPECSEDVAAARVLGRATCNSAAVRADAKVGVHVGHQLQSRLTKMEERETSGLLPPCVPGSVQPAMGIMMSTITM